MLVLNRKEKQSVFLNLEDGRKIKITAIKINPRDASVSIGFLADKTINIVREEVEFRSTKKKLTEEMP